MHKYAYSYSTQASTGNQTNLLFIHQFSYLYLIIQPQDELPFQACTKSPNIEIVQP